MAEVFSVDKIGLYSGNSCIYFSRVTTNISLTRCEHNHHQILLSSQLDSALYRIVEAEFLFNFSFASVGSLADSDFRLDCPIQIELSLKPSLLPQLLQYASTADEVLEYLVKLSQEHEERLGNRRARGQGSEEAEKKAEQEGEEDGAQGEFEINPLLLTESWLCLSVTQEQDNGKTTGYRTLWSYLPPAALATDNPDPKLLADGITQFFTDQITQQLNPIAQNFATDTLGAISNLFQELSNLDFDDSLNNSQTLFETMLAFFTQDDWSFLRIQGETALRLTFQGQNGIWNCYAKAREDTQQIVFYSICPTNAPTEKHPAVAEFITRANYGMAIGNFELDFADGEIRYKTSIDVEGDTLTPALIKNLVYPNILTMDRYLPGIEAILTTDQSPQAVLESIESA